MSSSTAASSQHIVQQLEPMRNKRVSVMLTDGRHLLGTLNSYDHLSNVMISNVTEHLYSVTTAHVPAATASQSTAAELSRAFEAAPSPQPIMLRGTMIAAIGLVDTLAEATGEV